MKYGRYEVVELLGSGSMGDVYKAYDPQFARQIALKVLKKERVVSDDYVKRFMRGAAAVGRLSHGNIGAAYDIGQEHGTIYIAMELLLGRTLKELIQENGVGGLDALVSIGRQVGEALHYAHQNGVVHRDIKPENIVCSSSGEIKVTDFGIAHIDDPDGQQMTQEGEVLGTPFYMSPEQYEGKPVDGRSDLYSLGVILYELATGQRPFVGKTFGSLYLAVTTHTVQPPHLVNPEVPKWLSGLIMKAMAREPNERYASGEELVRDLTRRQGAKKSQKQEKKPNTFILSLLIVVLLGGGAGFAYYLGYLPPITSMIGKKEKPVADVPEVQPEQATIEVTQPLTSEKKVTEIPAPEMNQPDQETPTGMMSGEQLELPADRTLSLQPEKEDDLWAIEDENPLPLFKSGERESHVRDGLPVETEAQKSKTLPVEPATGRVVTRPEPQEKEAPESIIGGDFWKTEVPSSVEETSRDIPPVANVAPRLEAEPVKLEPTPEMTLKSMVLNSRPEGAELFIDGKYKGKTPVKIEVSAEKHEIELNLAGHGELKAQLDFSKINKDSFTLRIPSL